jgi:protease-4
MSQQNWLCRRTVVYNPVPKPIAMPRRWRVFSILWQALKRTCTLLGALVLISAVITLWSTSQFVHKTIPADLPGEMILDLDLSGGFVEDQGPAEYLSRFGLGQTVLTVRETVDAIDRAAKDGKVRALVFRMGSGAYELTHIQDVRAAVERFKKTGKKTAIYAPSFGEGGSGLGMYYLASSFDDIWMQPVGMVAVQGLNLDAPYFKSFFEQFGVKAQFFQRKEYKNAMENMTADGMSPASREMMGGLIGEMADQIVAGVEVSRGAKLKGKKFRDLVDFGLFTDAQALASGLIDHLDDDDAMFHALRTSLGGKPDDKEPEVVFLEEYSAYISYHQGQKRLLEKTSFPKIALVQIDGMIVAGESGPGGGFDDKFAGADTISDAIRMAADDESIRAIVLRVNSPGGSPSASETIARAVAYAREKKNKAVVVSMGTMAASGGYWISAPATTIYAMDATLTGSIGVVGGKFDASGLWDKVGVKWDGVSYGANSDLWSFNKPFSVSGQERYEASLDNVYAHFVTRVAKGRNLTPQQVEKVAKGHVWTGRQAKQLGLVDKIGGLDVVFDDLAKIYGVKGREDLTVIRLPGAQTPFEALYEIFGQAGASLSFVQKLTATWTVFSRANGGVFAIAPIAAGAVR